MGDAQADQVAGPVVRAARNAPVSEVVRLSGRLYAPFLESHEQAVDAEIWFLQKHLDPRDPG